MLIRELRDGQTVELRIGELVLGYVGVADSRRGRVKLGLALTPAVRVSPADVSVSQLTQTEQFRKSAKPAA